MPTLKEKNPSIGRVKCSSCGMSQDVRREKGGIGRAYMTCGRSTGGCGAHVANSYGGVQTFNDFIKKHNLTPIGESEVIEVIETAEEPPIEVTPPIEEVSVDDDGELYHGFF